MGLSVRRGGCIPFERRILLLLLLALRLVLWALRMRAGVNKQARATVVHVVN